MGKLTPNQFLYLKQQEAKKQGKDVHELLDLFTFDAMYKKYTNEKMLQVLESICKVTGLVAVHSRHLTAYTKRKYKEKQVKVSGHAFYLFEKDKLPPDIQLEWEGDSNGPGIAVGN